MKKALGYKSISNVFGVAVYEMNDETVAAAFVQMDRVDKPRRYKVYYNKDGNAYFYLRGCRHYLKDFMRVQGG